MRRSRRQTCDLAATPLARELSEYEPPDTRGLPVVLSFDDAEGVLQPWRVVTRDALLADATQFRNADPARYARWRDGVQRGKRPQPRARDLGSL